MEKFLVPHLRIRKHNVNIIRFCYIDFSVHWEHFDLETRKGTAPDVARLITSTTNDIEVPDEYSFFYEIMIALRASKQYNFSLDQLIEKLPDMARLYQQLAVIRTFDPQLLLMPEVIKLPSDQLKKLCDACDDYDRFKENSWMVLYSRDQDFSSLEVQAEEVLYRLLLSDPDRAQSALFLVVLANKLYCNDPREGFARINSIADFRGQTNNVARFMLKLLGITVDLAHERIGDFFSALKNSPLLQVDDHLRGFFDLAFKNFNKITDEIIDSLVMFLPPNYQQTIEKNYQLLSEHDFDDTPRFTISSVVFYHACRQELSKAGCDLKRDLRNEKLKPVLIPYYELREYFATYQEKADDFSLTVLSKGHLRTKYWLEKMASLGELTWERYEIMMLKFSDKERQILFDNFQCWEVHLGDDAIIFSAESLESLREYGPTFLIKFVLSSATGHLYGITMPMPTEINVLKAITFFLDGCSFDLMASAMWCKNQESVACGRMLGKVIAKLNIPCSTIVNGSVLHENVQQGLLETLNPKMHFQFFDAKKSNWQDSGNGFSRILKA